MSKVKDKATKVEAQTEKAPAVTPKVLAERLEVNPKNLRAFLRREFPRSSEEKNTSWVLTKAQIDAATAHFTKADDGDEADES